MKNTRSNPLLVLVVMMAMAGAGYVWHLRNSQPVVTRVITPTGEFIEEDHFSPGENLEQIDLARIDSARSSLNIAMYAFTDKYLAEALVRAARRGVQVRIYRDRSQFDDEQRKNTARSRDSTTEIMTGQPNIHIRVKGHRELMHLKSYSVDGKLLRDGSANWSPTGLKRQDNSASFTTDPTQVRAFDQLFQQLWLRPGNREVQ